MNDYGTGDKPEPQANTATDVLKVVGNLTKWKNYVIYALIALALVEGGFIVWQRGTVAEAKLDVAKKDAEVKRIMLERDMAKANEKSCRVNLKDQNDKISDAGKRYKRLQDEMEELAKRIANGDFYKPADDVRKQPTPKNCEAALEFMNRNFP